MLNNYSQLALAFAKPEIRDDIMYAILGLCGESGEAAEKLKKSIRDNNRLDSVEIAKELGDVLWYVNLAANVMGYTLEDIAKMNISKLDSRMKRGVIGGSGDNR